MWWLTLIRIINQNFISEARIKFDKLALNIYVLIIKLVYSDDPITNSAKFVILIERDVSL